MTLADSVERRARIAVIYYSTGGSVDALAPAIAEGAAPQGANQVRE
jgi:hypothetical protein